MEKGCVNNMAEWFCLLPETAMFLTPLNGIDEYETDDPAKYLQKEKKIVSLRRRKKKKNAFTKDQTLECIRPTWEKTISCVSKRIGEGIQDEFMHQVEQFGLDGACRWLLAQLPHLPGLEIEEVADSQAGALIDCCAKILPGEKTYKGTPAVIKIHADDYQGLEYYTAANATLAGRYHKGRWKLRRVKMQPLLLADFKKLVSELYLRNYLVGLLQKLRLESGSMASYLERSEVGRLFRWRFDKSLLSRIDAQSLEKSELPYLGKPDEITESEEAFYRLIMDNQDPKGIGLTLSCGQLDDAFQLLKKEYLRKKEEERHARILSGDYARSFQTKKNIPEKCLRAMASSGFNNYFGYVEFDEECDLKLLPELYREYEALAETIGIPAYPDASLRFRKLGNHHAIGLYYPGLACLCVDLRQPNSMAHEVGHMIDYHCDHISEKSSFIEVYDCYASLLKDAANTTEDSALKERLKGRGKYNLSYYLQATEVFARCFEMYLIRYMKIDNSLCKPAFGVEYPEDDMLNELVKIFYMNLLKTLREEVPDDKKGREIPESAVL